MLNNKTKNELDDNTIDLNKTKTDTIEWAKEMAPELKLLYREFHEIPELGGEEFETSEKVLTYLRELGIEIVGEKIGGLRGKEGTGIVARIKGNSDKSIALRADMDALPIQESAQHVCKSHKPNVMHACGHDAHTTGLLGAAKILKKLSDEKRLPSDVYLIFQQNEEKAIERESGALRIIRFLERNGIREKLAAFYGLHVYTELERGTVGLKTGVQMASGAELSVKAEAPGGHVKNAYEEPNLNDIFSEITYRLSEIFREKAKNKEALIASTNTSFDTKASNVLPTKAEAKWTVRITSPNYKLIANEARGKIAEIVKDVINKSPNAEKVKIKTTYNPVYRPVVHRSEELVNKAHEAVQTVIPGAITDKEVLFGGEDFSFFLEEFRGKQIDGVFVLVGAANPSENIPTGPHHSPNFQIDQNVLPDLSALYVNLVLNT